MRPRTTGALVVVLLALGGAVAYGAFQQGTGAGQVLHEDWISDPGRTLESNHHSPAAVVVDGESYVAVPINSRQGTMCVLSVLDGQGNVRWKRTVASRQCTVHAVSDPTIADADRDGRPEILAATSAEEFVVYGLNGTVELRRNLTSYGYSKPLVADLTAADGRETAVVDLLGGVFVYRANGTLSWEQKLGDARVRQPAIRDFDADGDPELAVGQLGGRVVLLEHTGAVAWRTNLSRAVSIKWMTAGQADGDPAVELAVATYSGQVLLLDGDTGRIQWRRDFAVNGATVHAFGDGDGDGDGRPEVYAAARDGKIRSLNATDGTVEWTTTLTTETVRAMPPPSLGDVDGDDEAELVAPSNTGAVSIVDPATGEVLATYEREVPIWTYASLTDYDGDGTTEILVMYADGRVVALEFS